MVNGRRLSKPKLLLFQACVHDFKGTSTQNTIKQLKGISPEVKRASTCNRPQLSTAAEISQKTKQRSSSRSLAFIVCIKDMKEEHWPRLYKGAKHNQVKTDFSKWCDRFSVITRYLWRAPINAKFFSYYGMPKAKSKPTNSMSVV